ncbi:glycosyltransferase family 2 protein [bacterium]|nr:glycosyltransferase family 2 protein [bacterium]
MAKVSVILPVYNVKKYLRKCLNTLINQTLQDIEIICVDDCSTDGSLQILEEYAQKDKRIIIIKQEKNQGQGIARNKAIKCASGEYIGFVDPDDWVTKAMFETMYNQAKSLNSDIVMCNFKRYYECKGEADVGLFLRNTDKDFNKIFIKFPAETNLTKDQIYSILLISPCFVFNKIFNAKLIKDSNIHFSEHRCYEDIEFVLNAFLKAKNISYIEKRLYYYRQRQSSTLRALSNRCDVLIEIIPHIKNILIQNGVFDELEHNFKYFIIWATTMLKHQMTFKQKLRYYNNSKKYLDKKALSVLKKDLEIGFWQMFSQLLTKKLIIKSIL